MELTTPLSKDANWFFLTLPAFLGSKNLLDPYLILSILAAFLSLSLLTWAVSPGGTAWRNGRNRLGPTPIPGPRGIPLLGSLFSLGRNGLAHRSLAETARRLSAAQLMAFSLGPAPVVVSSDVKISREILSSPSFSDRPIKQSARLLMFSRAIGFAPNGTYWRLLRRISSTHLFSPKRILGHFPYRVLECAEMVRRIAAQQSLSGRVTIRGHLQVAALNNIMMSVFGKRYDPVHDSGEFDELKDMVREGFELLGAFNWSDYLPWVSYFYDPCRVVERCEALVPRVRRLVKGIIDEHRVGEAKGLCDKGDFVDVLLSLDGEEKLDEDDMVAVLWEMIFRGTDTTALLTEWVMAELVLHPEIQDKLFKELQSATNGNTPTDADLAKLPYLQAVIKETLRAHPPGPLLSWARLATLDVHLSNGMLIPAHTTAMVNMWAITHDPLVWDDPHVFNPDRFLGGAPDVDVRGGDLRLAPFGAGRRVCPGKNLGLATVAYWVAELVCRFEWAPDGAHQVDLGEVLKLSCEMKHPLLAVALPRNVPC